MSAVFGFNVGSVISLGDMEKTIDYISENSDKKEDANNIDEITERFMLKDLPQPITTDIIDIKKEINELDDNGDDIDEFDIDDSEFDEMFGDDDEYEDEYSEETEEEIETAVVDKDDLLKRLKEETKLEDRQRIVGNKYTEPIDNKDKKDSSTKMGEDNEIARLKKQLEKERELREEAERIIKEKQKSELLKELELERSKSNELKEQLNKEKARDDTLEREKLREKRIAELKAKKRKELIEKKKREILNDRVKQASAKKAVDKTNIYDTMEIEALYSEVRKYMGSLGIDKSIVDVKLLNEKFGSSNIRKLILRSYLISIGKGVTIGR